MPKVVDHEERRRQISEAVCRVVARRGFEAATVREVSVEAGYSTGVLSHYFENKEAMVSYAVGDYFVDQTMERLKALSERGSGMEATRTIFREMLPHDERSRDWWRAWLAFCGRAAHDEEMAVEQRRWYEQWRGVVRAMILACQRDGEVSENADVEGETDTLVALVDGIGFQATFEPERLTPGRQMRIVESHLAGMRSRS